MISVFQIFKMLIGIVIFIFVMIFFMQITDMYADVGERSGEYSFASDFDNAAMDVYISGNPGTFRGFGDAEHLRYEAPKLFFGSGQKTMSVPVFMIPDADAMSIERRCDDYGWFMNCYIFALPNASTFLFTPIDNTPEARENIKSVTEALPDTAYFGYCSGDGILRGNKTEFVKFIGAQMTSMSFSECTRVLPEDTRLVVFGEPENYTAGMISVHAGVVKSLVFDAVEEEPYAGTDDLIAAMTGGVPALKYKHEVFVKNLAVSASITRQRAMLVSSMFLETNVQPCLECATPKPKACGWTSYNGVPAPSTLYTSFRNRLVALENMVSSGSYTAVINVLGETAVIFEDLRSAGCE